MSNFIENIKASEWAKEAEASQANEIRLHAAQIGKARLPVLWDLTIAKVKQYCEELRPEFDKNPKFKFHVGYSPNGFMLVNDGPMPRRTIQANLNLNGLCIQVLSGIKSSFQSDAFLAPLGLISISVDRSDEVSFHFNGETWNSPDEMAEFFVRFVCEIK